MAATGLENSEILRYGRQLILPEWGRKGQVAVKSTSTLIVGCGGLGCPVAQYLAAAGIGHLGLLDYDTVEVSNLHRQVLHSEEKIGMEKAVSIEMAIKSLNTNVKTTTYSVLLNSNNAQSILESYDIVVDCTDNVATRYLLNDCCVFLNKTLVSGSALRFEGQLTVYHYKGGPCYRCIFPTPPPPESVTNCSEGGVLGVVPGIIGNLQALEVLKLASGLGPSYSQKLLLFDGLNGTFRTIKLRGRRSDCAVCGDKPTTTKLIDYVQFCGTSANDKQQDIEILSSEERLTCEDYKSIAEAGYSHVLLDVREAVQYEICALPNSINIPIGDIEKDGSLEILQEKLLNVKVADPSGPPNVIVVCRRGNDSQIVVKKLKERLIEIEGAMKNSKKFVIKDIRGGLESWSRRIDKNFPTY